MQLHFRGLDSERRQLPAVPETGSYLYGPENRLWRVEAVVFDRQAVGVYAVQVSSMLAGDLQAAWATWGDPS